MNSIACRQWRRGSHVGSNERIAVEGRPGITCRRTPGGRVRFEISVSDGEGLPRFLTVIGGLARAEAALAALTAARSSADRTIALTFGEALERWLESPSVNTRERQDDEWPVYVHLVPRLGHLQLGELGSGMRSRCSTSFARPDTRAGASRPFSSRCARPRATPSNNAS